MSKHSGRTRGGGEGGGSKGGSLLSGLLIGLLIGGIVAVGVAFYLSRGGDGLFSKKPAASAQNKGAAAPVNPEILRPAGSKNDGQPAPTVASPTAKASGPDRFDFYTVLPGLNDKNAKPQEPKKPEASPAAKSEAGKANWLQVGAFQNEQDADNLKAKLALIGIVARIQTVQLQDKGTWHRVRVGPYSNLEELDRVRGQLQANGIESSVLKGN